MFFKKGLETQQTHCRATRQILIESLVSNGTDTDAHQNCTAYCTPGSSYLSLHARQTLFIETGPALDDDHFL